MAGVIRLNLKEANELADLMEKGGNNPDSLRAAINDVNDARNPHSSVPGSKMDDEEYIQWMRSQSTVEKGEDLECMICHGKFDQLLSGTCENCFREWVLAVKRQQNAKKGWPVPALLRGK